MGGSGSVPAATVALLVPVFPSLSAWMLAAPSATPVTTPFSSTVAIDTAPLDHVTVRSVSSLPSASRSVTVS